MLFNLQWSKSSGLLATEAQEQTEADAIAENFLETVDRLFREKVEIRMALGMWFQNQRDLMPHHIETLTEYGLADGEKPIADLHQIMAFVGYRNPAVGRVLKIG